jgi:hypothetical protein
LVSAFYFAKDLLTNTFGFHTIPEKSTMTALILDKRTKQNWGFERLRHLSKGWT